MTAEASDATIERVTAVFRDAFGEAVAWEVSAGQLTVDVPAERWTAALELAKDRLGARFFDWLTAVDELDEGYTVIAHVCSAAGDGPLRKGGGLLLRTRVTREQPVLDSAVAVYRGANWHERETHEMFGVEFTGHPNLVPLLLPDGFDGHPLRKEFVLAARVAKAWPGAKEPGESDASRGAPSRRRMLPPGVPDEWLKPLAEAGEPAEPEAEPEGGAG